MKKTARIIILLSILSLPLFATTSHARKTTERDLKKFAESINKNVDKTPNPNSGVRMDSVSAGPGLLVTYNAIMTKHTAADLKLNEFYPWMKNILLGKLCNNQDMKNLLQDNVTLRYNYKGYDGRNITDINISRKDCNF